GSHRTGKSTLIAELAALLPDYRTVEEPYFLLEDDGHEFCHPPSIEDYEAQLARSIGELEEAVDDVLFDRCPLDLLAYIAVHDDNSSFDIRDWLLRVRSALQTLDLVVLVPIEDRDRIAESGTDDDGDGEVRVAVDEKLKELICDDPYGFGLAFVEVRGNLGSRTQAVLQELG
ncbi:MAG: AAA family ATPase, partial [bacterium]|nr:AAA family ATPase [bacterium]